MVDNFAKNLMQIGYDPRKTVVQCHTLVEAKIFLDYLVEKGVWERVQASVAERFYDKCTSCACYHFSSREWDEESWYRKNRKDYKIVNFCDIYEDYRAKVFDFAIGFDELMNGVPTNGGGVSF